ncbi:protein PHOTOPERIOD-INDEPENDENT EARLY FLOWERING 1 isoform X2 [Phalaenopsis equestris]|uniref:protein PHOTOPERIOD-INDEPENDENT EARLY FLOWERING 1 isoform X2 n=1 Tax=Phalaenopsis equestris TaxID=78828 RepID=UPI0009E3EE0F|nr:protein PHOTOPERIOD-INDEPENDENT EARLY FLOWERING 1 isoform X2 [Phalaenopsis equestris]
MASKGPRSKLDHESRTKRQKAFEAPREPPRPKVHWDHVLEEMVWLSKDFESERKWKLSLAKKVALRASKNSLDQVSKNERKLKEEEQRMRKIALNISKEVKKFWMKIEKLVLYKYQLESEERKKKALDKQLDFLLGQTERYSTMLAENLVDMPGSHKPVIVDSEQLQSLNVGKADHRNCTISSPTGEETQSDIADDYIAQSDDDLIDDEHTIEDDEAQITEAERREELIALQADLDLPLEELLKKYTSNEVSREVSPEVGEHVATEISKIKEPNEELKLTGKVSNLIRENRDNSKSIRIGHHDHFEAKDFSSCTGGQLAVKSVVDPELRSNDFDASEQKPFLHSIVDEVDDEDYLIIGDEEKDDEGTLSEEEELAKREAIDPLDEIKQLQQESDLPLEELLGRYGQEMENDDDIGFVESDSSSSRSDGPLKSDTYCVIQPGDPSVSSADHDHVSEREKSAHEIQDSIAEDIEGDMKLELDKVMDKRGSENMIADAAAAARSAQPTGNTFSTTKVRTKFPFLLKHPLREYQHIGLDWLVTLYDKRLNGILADEMGLGKTIMTIALLAHLACEKGIWGPHLIVVPTSVMLNWETEFLRWCPAFKILTYFGSAKERKHKRQGWLKLNSFHVCITTYRLIIQDSKVFKRKKWKYLILDEAHLIKNWKSQRWQTLLNFNSKRRILLTGTPLQNDLMELWSLMHFLMPHIFQSHQEFKDWFSNPISGMVEGQEKVNREVVDRLHNVLRPFILRRLKRDVEKQLPKKHEHVIYCRLSRRQRNLYEDFIASSETQATLASTNFFGMISVIMQLRKVCNHPDLFEGRPIISSYDMAGINMQLSSDVSLIFSSGPFSGVNLKGLNLIFSHHEFDMISWESEEVLSICSSNLIEDNMLKFIEIPSAGQYDRKRALGTNIFEEIQKALFEERLKQLKERAASIAWWNNLQCQKKPIYGTDLRELVTVKHPVADIHKQKSNPCCYMKFSSYLGELVLSADERFQKMIGTVESFMFAIPAARAPPPVCWSSKAGSFVFRTQAYADRCTEILSPLLSPYRPAIVRRQVYFPDRRLIQFDCGKLQELSILLRRLKSEGHRALIFTQMTKMLDILEAFINLYGYTYMRLDGSTLPEQRQTLMQRFNTNPKFFLFILSTRSGGVGINLVGADTVIFYDSDWNPAMDQQAQDRCHRIGQTREVHIYRLISESTIEENILKKANQKRMLDDLVIQSGSYNTDFFKKLDPMELLSNHKSLHVGNFCKENNYAESFNHGVGADISNADVEAAIMHAEDEADYIALKRVEQEEAVENQEFSEDAIGRAEDDENEEETMVDEKVPDEHKIDSRNMWSKDNGADNLNEENALTLIGGSEEIDMLADVKQMAAAAAAAGHSSSTFENHLQPIDRYAMRFLDLWDPIIDKSSIEYHDSVEEEDWELDRIEKLKEDMEAEIDDDQEPLLYESWDAEFATTAYRQHVEALAQQQLLEEKECEAKDADDEDESSEAVGNGALIERKAKTKKKLKKTKFKTLRKGHLASETEVILDHPYVDSLPNDERNLSSNAKSFASLPQSSMDKKRKKATDEKFSQKGSKKLRISESKLGRDSSSLVKQHRDSRELNSEDGVNDIDLKRVNRSKMGGKVSITVMPLKRVMVVKPEKLKKKGHVWSKDYFPPTDYWFAQEDAILCALVHEYGTNWTLVSDALYSMPGGGCYRGFFHHPVHCCERFRELFVKYVQSTVDSSNSEKNSATGSGKSLLKVTEEHVHSLLNVTSDLPDNELILQKHFVAILSSVWRETCRHERSQTMLSSRTGYHLKLSTYSPIKKPGMDLANLRHSKKLVMAALNDVNVRHHEQVEVLPMQEAPILLDKLELTLDLSSAKKACSEVMIPSSINVSIHVFEQKQCAEPNGTNLIKPISKITENRFRLASQTCLEGESPRWATLSFPFCDARRSRSGSKSQHLGKHKAISDPARPPKSKVPRTMEESGLLAKAIMPSTRPIIEFNHLALSVSHEDNDIFGPHEYDPELLEDTHLVDPVPHEYDPELLEDLEDLDLQLHIGDIG